MWIKFIRLTSGIYWMKRASKRKHILRCFTCQTKNYFRRMHTAVVQNISHIIPVIRWLYLMQGSRFNLNNLPVLIFFLAWRLGLEVRDQESSATDCCSTGWLLGFGLHSGRHSARTADRQCLCLWHASWLTGMLLCLGFVLPQAVSNSDIFAFISSGWHKGAIVQISCST